MIELSFSKLLLVAVIALIVLGPEKLPKVARMAGAMLRRARVGWESVRSEVEHELQLEEGRRAAREATARAKAFEDSLRSATDAVNTTVRDTAADVTTAANSVAVSSTSEHHANGDA